MATVVGAPRIRVVTASRIYQERSEELRPLPSVEQLISEGAFLANR
jgi:hypothetical protein